MNTSRDTSSISFTALYTGQVWYENGMSAPFFTSPKGRLMYLGLQPLEKAIELALGTNMNHMLLQRHHILDYRLTQLIDEGVTQVLEIACGLSPRGHEFTKRFPHIHYIEADLPDMAQRKQTLLEDENAFGPNHQVIPCNILEHGAPHGLDHILQNVLDPNKPTVVITEGLVNYFSKEAITPFWETLARLGKDYNGLWYLADCYPLSKKSNTYKWVNAFMKTLGTVTRAEVNSLFESDEELKSFFEQLGFENTKVHRPEDYYHRLNIPKSRHRSFTRILEAKV